MWHRDDKWVNVFAKMTLIDFLHSGLLQTFNFYKNAVSANCIKAKHSKTRYAFIENVKNFSTSLYSAAKKVTDKSWNCIFWLDCKTSLRAYSPTGPPATPPWPHIGVLHTSNLLYNSFSTLDFGNRKPTVVPWSLDMKYLYLFSFCLLYKFK